MHAISVTLLILRYLTSPPLKPRQFKVYLKPTSRERVLQRLPALVVKYRNAAAIIKIIFH